MHQSEMIAQPPGEFRWTPAWRKALLPWRGEDFAAPAPLERAAVTVDFAQRLAATQASPSAQHSLQWNAKAVGFAFDLAMLDPARLAESADSAHWAALLRLLIDFSSAYPQRTAWADAHALWQLCAALHGLPFALEVLRAALAGRAPMTSDDLARIGLPELRARIAVLDDAAYAPLRDAAIAAAADGVVAGVMAYLFPTEPALIAPAVEALPAHTAGREASLLMECRLDESQAQRVYASTAGWDHRWPTFGVLHLNLARLRHPQALVIALDGMERQHASEWRRDMLGVIRAHDSAEALAALLARLDDKAARALAEPFAAQWPELAIRLAAERVAAGTDKALREWLERFVTVHAEALAAARAHADAAIRPLLDRMAARQAARAPEAPLDALPEWLRAPPWRAGKRAAGADPAWALPGKPPKLPDFWQPAACPPLLRDGRALPASVLDAIGEMLAATPLEAHYIGLDELRELCTRASLGAFAWALFEAWLGVGAPGKAQWAFAALAHLGDDECARKLARLIRAWPTEGASARAAMGLEVLAGMGSDVALMLLSGIAQKVKSKPLQAKAQAKLEQLAQARGLSEEELADRLVPDLGLAEDGTMVLDFGPRQFVVGFDEHLQPLVRDAGGALLKDLPAPGKSDDAALAESAVAQWKALKKDARTLAALQLRRLESAMALRRRWRATEFRACFVEHPLMRHLARRLLWAEFAGGVAQRAFRVAEDLSFADARDELLTLQDDAVVGLAHPLELAADELAAFTRIFADYEIAQPFVQLGREVHRLSDDERAGSTLARFAGRKVAIGSLVGLESRGWRKDELTTESGRFAEAIRVFEDGARVRLPFTPGAWIGDVKSEPAQTLQALELEGLENWGAVDPVLASEILRDIERLAVLA